MIEYDVKVTDDASPMLRDFIKGLSGEQMNDLNDAGGRSAVNSAKEFHREFDAAGGWRGQRNSGSGPSDFGANIVKGWFFKSADSDGATIANNADHYGFKIRGGTIRPKRVRFLTIPLIPEAKGRRARDFELAFGKLFRPRGKDVLMQRTPDGQARSVYALRDQVTQRPWPDALPPDEVILEGFQKGFRKALGDYIETL